MKKTILKILAAVLIFGLFITACTKSLSETEEIDPKQLSTLMAGTISARLTQIAVGTMIVEATQLAMYTATPTITETPSVTSTPTLTNTPTITSTPIYTHTPLTPTATPITPTSTTNPTPCNQASLIADVTVAENTIFVAGQSFVKTWRIKNTGSCNWTTSYSLYFYSGNALGAPSSIAMPKTVKPGETVDLSLSMVAPSVTGDYTSGWMINVPNSVVFGVGTSPGSPLTVKIKVASIPSPHDTYTIYDFVGNYCSGQWRTNAGYITCPTNSFDFYNGTISRTYAPVLESGVLDDEGTLITIPSYGGDGFIQGQFPQVLIHSGDHFKATLLCTVSRPNCSVTFEVLYKINGTDTVTSLGTWDKTSDGTVIPIDLDLSALDGQNVIFFLKVSSKGDPTDDFAQWMAVRVTHP